jgi:hypothetical protein
MKLGEIQPNKPYKFLQEEILEGVWPLSKFKSLYSTSLLIFVYVFWGFMLFLIYPISNYYIVAGSISAIGISIWTFGIIIYANSLRNIELEENNTNFVFKKILLKYMDSVFHNSSLFYGVTIAMVVYVIILNSAIIKDDILLSSIFLLYIFYISFDICYRVGLSFHILLSQIRRNFSIFKILKEEKLRSQLNKEDFKKIQNTDKYHYLAIFGGIFLFPITFIDILFFISLIGVVLFVFITATINIITLHFILNKYFDE